MYLGLVGIELTYVRGIRGVCYVGEKNLQPFFCRNLLLLIDYDFF